MRIESTVKKNDNMDFKHDEYTWLKFVPEKDYDRYTYDLMLIGRMTVFMDKKNVEYKLEIVGGEIIGLEVHESFFMKFMTTQFWIK